MNKQNLMSGHYAEGSDLEQREKEILEEVRKRLGFEPDELMGKSAWWGSQSIGALHYLGTYQGKKAVLKIQGVKPQTSEIFMITSFSQANKSSLVRSPHLFASLPWDEKRRYEALVMEYIDGTKIVQTPTNAKEIADFFAVYQDYKENCLDNPWIDKPEETLSEYVGNNFAKWRQASHKIYPDHPFRESGDEDLINQAVKVLQKGYQDVDFEFMHGHFSETDLYQVGDQVVLLSNLYWSWRAPLYDAVFGYHWFMYHLSDVEGITKEKIEEQRRLWLDAIKSLPQAQKNPHLLQLALLERAAAGLNLDVLSVNSEKPIARYLVTSTREDVKLLIDQIL